MEVLRVLAQHLEVLVDAVPGGAMTGILGLAFIAVFLAVLGVGGLFGRDPVARRLAGDAPRRRPVPAGRGAAPLRRTAGQGTRWDALLAPLERYFADRRESAPSSLRLRLMQAGLVGPNAVRTYVVVRVLLSVAAPLAFIVSASAWGGEPSLESVAMGAAVLSLAGLYLPRRWVSARVERRRRSLAASFADALDMMVVCLEAGLGLDAALTRVGTQIAPAHPILAAELGLVALELRAGNSREAALRNFAKRTGVREIASFVTLLVQADALGTGIAHALRVHADELRASRMLRAEEMAHKLPVKLTVPLVACILPAMMAVVLLPGVITIVRDVLPRLGN
ncbi:MAG: type II secretion system F family protein [Kiloniellaceae bacterium]